MANDVNVKISADASSYNRSIKEITQESKTLSSELKKVKSSFDENTTTQEKGAKIAEVVSKQIKNQEEKVAKLKEEYERLTQEEGDNTIALSKQQELINKAETALNGMNAELKDAQNMADGYGDEAEDAARQTGVMDEAARTLAASKLADFYNAVSEAAQKLASAAYDAAKEVDAGYDTIAKKTGATGDALKGLQSSADNVFGNMPADMADVGTAIGEVNTRFGLTGDELENVSETFLKFANITDTDVNTAVSTTSRLLKTYGGSVKDADKLLGYFAKQSQSTGVETSKLLSSLDQNGATLREMGLDLQQSTKLLALFEQNGVDSAGAMTGLRKAVINGAKEGKSFNDVISEASEKIKNAATDTEALEIATELFGTKGAVVMADGLRSGRIDLNDLTESIQDYGDVVNDTYEATISPWDKAKVAVNNLKAAGSELAGEALSAIAPLLDKVVDLVKDGVKWFKNLPDPVKKVVAVVGLLGTGAGVALPKVMSLFNTLSMFKAANAVKGLTSVSDATKGLAGNASKAGSAVTLLTNPLALGVTAVGALGLGLAALAKHAEDAAEAEYGLTQEQKEQIAATDAAAEAAREMAAARQEAIDSVSAEYGYIENLAREYDTLIDANGKVKQGYEDRANFILGELSEATGKSIEEIQAETDAQGKLSQSIYDIINAKKAEAMLSAVQDDYTNAIREQSKAQQDYAEKVALAAERQKEYDAVLRNVSGMMANRNALAAQLETLDKSSTEYANLKMQLDEMDVALGNEQTRIATSKAALDEANRSVAEASTTMAQYNSTIANYEALSAAVATGSAPQIQMALENVTRSFQTSATGTKESLEAQLKAAQDGLNAMEAAFRNGAVDQAAVDAARKLVIDARRELKELEQVGRDSAAGLEKGLQSGSKGINKQGQKMGEDAVKGAAKGAQTASPSKATKKTGEDVGEGLIRGMKAKEGGVKTGGTTIGQKAIGGVTSGASAADARKVGESLGDSLRQGIDAKRGAVGTSATAVATTANTNIKPNSTSAYNAGWYAGDGVRSGIANRQSSVASAASSVASAANSNIKPNSTDAYNAGYNLSAGIAKGIRGGAYLVNAAASDVSTAAIRTVRNIAQISSPSKVFEQIGEYMTEGLAIGLSDLAPVNKAMSQLEKAVTSPSLTFGEGGINGRAISKTLTYGDIVVNVSGANVQNEDLLAKKISNELFRQVKAQKAALA